VIYTLHDLQSFLEDLSILGACAKLRKATTSFVMSDCLSTCLSVHMEQFGSHLKDFHEISYLSIFRKSVQIQVSLKSNKNNVYIASRPMYIFITSHSVPLRLINVSDKDGKENQNAHTTVYSITFFFRIRAIY
jgi:hypothetical protein